MPWRRRFGRIFHGKLKIYSRAFSLFSPLKKERKGDFRLHNIQLRRRPSGNRNCFRNYSECRFTRQDAPEYTKGPEGRK